MNPVNEMNFKVLIEEDKAEGDFVAYIPALRLGAHGHSLEEVRENAKDLLLMELEARMKQGKQIPSDDTASMESISVTIPVAN